MLGLIIAEKINNFKKRNAEKYYEIETNTTAQAEKMKC
jgi:hypothetical protein